MSDSFMTPWTTAHQALLSVAFPTQEHWRGLPFLLQAIFLTQGSNLCLLHWQANSFSSVQFSRSVMSDFLQPHGSQHARLPCPLPTPRVHSNSCPSSQWCHPVISSSVIPFSSCPQSLPASVFSNESTLHTRWPKYWSFSFSVSPSNEHPGLISFRMDWLDLLEVQVTLILYHWAQREASIFY